MRRDFERHVVTLEGAIECDVINRGKVGKL